MENSDSASKHNSQVPPPSRLSIASNSRSSLRLPEHIDTLDDIAAHSIASDSGSGPGFPEHNDPLGTAHSITLGSTSSLGFPEHNTDQLQVGRVASQLAHASLHENPTAASIKSVAASIKSTTASVKSKTSKHSTVTEHSPAPSVKEPKTSKHSTIIEHSPASSVKGSKTSGSKHSTVTGHSLAPSVKESIHLTGQPGPLQHGSVVENSRSLVPSLAGSTSRPSLKVLFSGSPSSGSIREIKGSPSSMRNSQPPSRAESANGLSSSGSPGPTKGSPGPTKGSRDSTKGSTEGGSSSGSAAASERAPSAVESLHSRTATTKVSSRSQTPRTSSAVEPVKSRASSLKELFSGTSGSTRESSRPKQDPVQYPPSISSADRFQQDCTSRAQKVREALSKTHQFDSPKGQSPGKGRKANKVPNISPATAKVVFAIAQSMGGPDMPEGLEKKLKDKKAGKK